MARKQRKGADGPHAMKQRRRSRPRIKLNKPPEPTRKGDPAKQTSAEFKAEMLRLKELRKAEKDADRRKALAAHHEKIRREYLQWQDDLCWLIRNRSTVEVKPDGSALYILPKELVRLVWQTTIAQRVATEKAKGLDSRNAMAKAMEGLSAEVAALAVEVKEGKKDESQHAGTGQPDGAGGPGVGDNGQDQPTG